MRKDREVDSSVALLSRLRDNLFIPARKDREVDNERMVVARHRDCMIGKIC